MFWVESFFCIPAKHAVMTLTCDMLCMVQVRRRSSNARLFGVIVRASASRADAVVTVLTVMLYATQIDVFLSALLVLSWALEFVQASSVVQQIDRSCGRGARWQSLSNPFYPF